MSTPNTKRDQLIAKLKEMFQMDQADLDFGIYRIMNAKRDEVERFLDKELLPTLRTTLEEFQPAGLADKQKELADAIANARKLKIDPDSLEIVQQLKAELAEGGDLDRLENQVYSDLHTFFSRYYQDGDFLSLRRYKEGVYAMPYEGEEVKLHWANADQYYIKTAENFTRYAFKTAQGRVRFELAAASTERDNNKAAADNERRFILAAEPLAMDGDELIIRFEYRPDADKRKQKELSTLAVTSLLALPEGAPLTEGVPQWPVWRAALANALPSDKNKTRTVFEKHLTDYTAKNTFDYFIHKDLGGFLKRELDFFIKNEVMHLDDIEDDSAPRVESYLARIKAMRRISHKLIAFLAQLENFQQRLWLKKKFVLETQWLITVDRIPEALYPEICDHAEKPVLGWDGRAYSQREEWVELFGIDKIKGDLADAVAYSIPLSPAFLKANTCLVLDTARFPIVFKERLLASVERLDRVTNGVLIQGDNFQALSLLSEGLSGSVKSIYIDPPYNTGDDGFVYKDNYKESSWLSLISDRMEMSKRLMSSDATFSVSIDDEELGLLRTLMDKSFGSKNRLPLVTVKRGSVTGHKVINPGVVKISDFLLSYANDKGDWSGRDLYSERERDSRYDTYLVNFDDGFENWKLCSLLDAFSKEIGIDKRRIKKELGDDFEYRMVEFVSANAKKVVQLVTVNISGVGKDFADAVRKSDESPDVVLCHRRNSDPDVYLVGGKKIIFYKDKLALVGGRFVTAERTSDIWLDVLPNDLHNEGGVELRKGKKPEALVSKVIQMSSDEGDCVLDFFCGSGTTIAAAHKMKRVWLGIENADYFDEKPLMRLKLVLQGESGGISKNYSWKGGGFVKYIRLESYEDCLENLSKTARSHAQNLLIENSNVLRESYILNYMLDIENRGSLLNLDKFVDPFNVEMMITRNNDVRKVKVDMVETFNFLLGLHVQTMRRLKDVYEVVGVTPAGDHTLILWRDVNKVDNEALDKWFDKQAYSSRDKEFDLIYVNGDNNIENLRRDDETWKVQLIEERFLTLMFDSGAA